MSTPEIVGVVGIVLFIGGLVVAQRYVNNQTSDILPTRRPNMNTIINYNDSNPIHKYDADRKGGTQTYRVKKNKSKRKK